MLFHLCCACSYQRRQQHKWHHRALKFPSIREYIAAGQRTVAQVQNDWIDSPGHCANVMNQQIVEMGATCVVESNSDYGTYWTVVVGEPQ